MPKRIRKSEPQEIDTFATRLRSLLEQADLSARQLARLAGLPQPTVLRYVQGNREPTFDNALRLAKALNVSIETFAYPVTLPESEP